MVIKDVPFYPNHQDSTHCYQSVLKMILKYFLPSKEFSWEALEKITDKKEGKPTWAMRGLMNMKKMGFDVKQITSFDQKSFAEKGLSFLKEKYGEEYANLEASRSDVSEEQETAKEFIKTGIVFHRVPTIEDLKNYINKGYLVVCLVNNGMHYVLVYGYDDQNIYFHNPGGSTRPGVANRVLAKEEFLKGWRNEKGELGAIQVFKLS